MSQVLFIVLAAFLVERSGRVMLLLGSCAGIAFSQTLIGLSFSMGGAVWLALTGQCLFMAFFSIGAGPCSMMVAAECFPLQARSPTGTYPSLCIPPVPELYVFHPCPSSMYSTRARALSLHPFSES